MEPTKFESLEDAATFMGVSKQILIYTHNISIGNPLSLGGKMEPKYFSWSGLRIVRQHNIYPSWINLNLAGQGFFSFQENLSNFLLHDKKIPHSMFKAKPHPHNSGVAKCPCGQTIDFASERDRNMKIRMHNKVCPKPIVFEHIERITKKSMTLREYQIHKDERMRRVHENN